MPNGSRTGSTQALCNLIGYAAGKGWEMAVACRTGGELLEQLVDWIVDKLADDQWSIPQIKAVLAQT